MTANRPHRTGPLEEAAFIEVLFAGTQLSPLGWAAERRNPIWRPPTDVYETEDHIVILVEIAGVQSTDFAVSFANHRLTITGIRHDPGPHHRAYHQLEVRFGEFRVDVDIAAPVTDSAITAEYREGLLRVTLPKARVQSILVR
jgi:HSP20 family protein